MPTVAGMINCPIFSSRVIDASIFSVHDVSAFPGFAFCAELRGSDASTFEVLSNTNVKTTLFNANNLIPSVYE